MIPKASRWAGLSLWSLFALYHCLLAAGSSLPLPPSIAGAVFYALTLCSMVAWPRTSLVRVGGWTLLGASLPELASTAATHVAEPSRWLVEAAAVVGALLPVAIERARSRRVASLGPAPAVRRERRPVVRELRREGAREASPETARVVIDHGHATPTPMLMAADAGGA